MLRFFGGLLAEDYVDFAPVYKADHTIVRPNVATLNIPGRTLTAGSRALDPQDHFTMQLWSAVTTMAQFPATYDQTYMNYTRLWVDGSVEEIQVPAAQTVSYTSPWTFETYRAMHIPCTRPGDTGNGVGCSGYVHPATGAVADEAGVAARMILHLNDMEAVRQQAIGAGDAEEAAAVGLQEQKYLDLVNVMRNMTLYFGHGYAALP